MASGRGGAADAAAREGPQFQPLLRNGGSTLRARAVGAGFDPRERGVDLADGDLEVGAAALGDRVGDGLGALGKRLLALADAIGAVLLEQGAETAGGVGAGG